MTALLEDPLPIILFGIVAEAILGVILFVTGRGVLLLLMGGVLLVVLAGVGLERLVVTERERVEAMIESTWRALEANDRDRVFEHLAPKNRHSRNSARRALGWLEFTEIKVTDLQVELIPDTDPPAATVRVTAVISARDRRGTFGEESGIIGIRLDLRRQSDRWLITGHKLTRGPAGY